MLFNVIGKNDFITIGPVLSVNRKFFEKKLAAGLTSSYNVSRSDKVTQAKIMNVRLNSTYSLLKKHNLSLSAVNQFRKTLKNGNTNDLTATLGYNYNF